MKSGTWRACYFYHFFTLSPTYMVYFTTFYINVKHFFIYFCKKIRPVFDIFWPYFYVLCYNLAMFIKINKTILSSLIIVILFSCSNNTNSSLNNSSNEPSKTNESTAEIANNNTNNKTLVIDKDYGKGSKDVVIFSTNDTLASFNENLSVASIKYYYDHFDKEENFTTLVDTGNFSVGSIEAEKSKGKVSIEIMNAVGYDIVVPGSYEFNYGIDTFYENMNMLKSNVVCCNIYDINKKTFPFLPYVIYKYDDLKIAFVGVTSPEALLLKDNYEKFFDENGEQLIYFFEDETGEALYRQVQTAVDTAKEEGADKVILLSHLGIEGITERWTTTRVIANTKDIDAVIDGHSMEVLDSGLMVNKVGAFIPLVQAGSNYKYVGAINITKEDYIYPAIMRERSINKKDEKFQQIVDEIIDKYK